MTELSTTSGVTCPQVRVWDEGVLFRVYWKLKGSLTALNPRSCSQAAGHLCMFCEGKLRKGLTALSPYSCSWEMANSKGIIVADAGPDSVRRGASIQGLQDHNMPEH